MLERFKKWMNGRYGADQLSLALLICSILLILINLPFHFVIIKLLALFLLILCYVRLFSKNIYKRQQENFKFLRWWTPLQKRLQNFIKRLKSFRTHKYFRCPHCKQRLRVPRGKGKICITCPKCKTELHKRS